MTNKTQHSRRKLLKALTFGGSAAISAKAIPEKWVQPMVDSVLLPVHAQVSACAGVFCADLSPTAPVFVQVTVQADGTVSAQTSNPGGDYFGSGSLDAGGNFGFPVETSGGDTDFIEGTIAPDCSSISGRYCLDVGCAGEFFNYVATPEGCVGDPSDRNLKENFDAVDGKVVLERLTDIPVSVWNYKSDDRTVCHMGPMAQDFHKAFGLGVDDKHIHMIDANGVNTAAIQGLYQLFQEKDAQIEALQNQVELLKTQIERLT